MKLMLFSDLHCDLASARRFVEQSCGVDVVVGAGDFATVRRGLDTIIDVLKAIDRPTVVVPGNNETLDELAEACRSWPTAHVLHGSAVTIDGIDFYGMGAAVPVTPFGSWSYDISEEQAAELLIECPTGCVLVSHSPPNGTVDVTTDGQSLGSNAVREVIEQKRPSLVVCGHIHASAGQVAMFGETAVVNAGPSGIVWDLQDGSFNYVPQ